MQCKDARVLSLWGKITGKQICKESGKIQFANGKEMSGCHRGGGGEWLVLGRELRKSVGAEME